MKGLIVLMCALAAVQARSTAVSKSPVREAAALGENPWVLHLRIAVSTSGLLDTCGASLIDASWALTASSCVSTVRFIWIRYGTINVINPELVTENSIVRIHPGMNGFRENTVALIAINRVVEYTANIAPVKLPTPGTEIPGTADFCSFSDAASDVPGETLSCVEVELTVGEDTIETNNESSVFDIGAPLVKDGVQYGVLNSSVDGVSIFNIPGDFLIWIEEQTGLDFGSNVDAIVAEADPTKVNFVN